MMGFFCTCPCSCDETPHDGKPCIIHDTSRFINCEVCQTEGRILTNDGGPDDVDHGVCPACNGERVVEIKTQTVSLEDLQEAHG